MFYVFSKKNYTKKYSKQYHKIEIILFTLL